jgi:predicted transcriptional regulator
MSILAEILEISKEGILKTQIMYRANLSFTQLNDYLNFMLNLDLIAKTNHGSKEIYIITEKGLNFLQKHSELIKMLKTDGTGSKNKIPL